MALRDYLFIDDNRLDAYSEQLRADRTSSRSLSWKVGLSVTGPKAEISGSEQERQSSRIEKIDALLSHLRETKRLDRGRITDPKSYHSSKHRVFRLETGFNAIPARLPPRTGIGHLTIWLSETEASGKFHRLILLQSARQADEDNYANHSAYSVLLALQEETGDIVKALAGAGVGPAAEAAQLREAMTRPSSLDTDLFRTGPGSEMTPSDERLARIVRTRQQAEARAEYDRAASRVSETELQRRFSENPSQLFAWLGAQVGAQRRVDSLYRVRAVMLDPLIQNCVVTIGYPIFIAYAE